MKKGPLGKAKTVQLTIAVMVGLVFSAAAIMLTLQLLEQVSVQSKQQVLQVTQSAKEIEKKYKDLQQKLSDLQQAAVNPQKVTMALAPNPSAGFRAFTIPIDTVSGVSGGIQPDTYVDVFFTGTLENNHQSLTRTLMQNIRILYTGPYQLGSLTGKSNNMNPGTATLEVTPLQSELLALAVQSGKLHLALRGHQDKHINTLPTITQSFLATGKAAVPKLSVPLPPPDLPPPPVKPSFAMEVFKGTSSETQTFEAGGK